MQLALFPAIKDRQATARNPAQESAFESILTVGRIEVLEQEEIGRSLYSDFTKMLGCPIDRYLNICRVWHQSKGRNVEENHQAIQLPPPQKKLQPPIRQWSNEAKQRKRLMILQRKMAANYSLCDLRHNAIQEKILENPNYYGMCPLPNQFHCRYYPPNLAQQAAIVGVASRYENRENKLRAAGL